MAHQLEVRVGGKRGDVLLPAGEKIVDADDLIAIVQEPLAKMGAEETRTPGDMLCA